MKLFAYAYTLPAFEGCTLSQKLRRNNIHRGVLRGEDVPAAERQIIERHPGRKILVRYIEEIERAAEALQFRPAFLDINSHLWWEVSSALVERQANVINTLKQ
jgi:hypothetical protein